MPPLGWFALGAGAVLLPLSLVIDWLLGRGMRNVACPDPYVWPVAQEANGRSEEVMWNPALGSFEQAAPMTPNKTPKTQVSQAAIIAMKRDIDTAWRAYLAQHANVKAWFDQAGEPSDFRMVAHYCEKAEKALAYHNQLCDTLRSIVGEDEEAIAQVGA